MDVKPGAVCVIDCSLPVGHERQVRYRRPTRVELAQAKRDRAAGLELRRREAFLELRLLRDGLLRATDHLEADAPWQRWRQRLRDLPASTSDPERVRWPKPPRVVSCIADYRSLWPRMDWSLLTKGT